MSVKCCEKCGVEFSVANWNASRRFCSPRCYHSIPRHRTTPPEDFFGLTIPEPNSGCWLWLGPAQNMGYGVVNYQRKAHLAHRIAYEITNGPIPEGMEICHRCDVPLCVNPDHLFMGSHAENMGDCRKKGRIRIPGFQGSAHGNAKLSESDVRAIRADGRSLNFLAAKYKISKTTVSEIKSRKSWTHI